MDLLERTDTCLTSKEALRLLDADPSWTDLTRYLHSSPLHRISKTVSYSRNVCIPVTRICRNRCGYCSFVEGPGEIREQIRSPEEIEAALQLGVRKNCKEALFLLGERPEEVAPEIREVLASWGYEGMLEYLCSMCEMALEFGMLPHTNAGLLHGYELERLRRVNASMGLMLESSSERLCRAGGPHERSPGKLPALRLQCIEEAGKLRIPLTTGILVGIGEEPAERIEALGVLKELHRRYGHIQEIIIQQFCPKSGTPMAAVEEPPTEEMLRTIVFARLMFGKAMNIQAPYNLIPRSHHLYLRAGANDWGGISPLTRDVINPEKKRPDLADVERKTRSAGYVLKERLAVYPEFMSDEYLSPRIRGVALSLVQPDVYAGVKSDA